MPIGATRRPAQVTLPAGVASASSQARLREGLGSRECPHPECDIYRAPRALSARSRSLSRQRGPGDARRLDLLLCDPVPISSSARLRTARPGFGSSHYCITWRETATKRSSMVQSMRPWWIWLGRCNPVRNGRCVIGAITHTYLSTIAPHWSVTGASPGVSSVKVHTREPGAPLRDAGCQRGVVAGAGQAGGDQ